MVASILGHYLMSKEVITVKEFKAILKEQEKSRVKLGLIAVAEGFMSVKEADRVNRLQAIMDKRFGDIAIENNLLTEGQVATLLRKQGNPYLSFAQALENLNIMTLQQLEHWVVSYQNENHLSPSDMEALKSDDVDNILHIFLPSEGQQYSELAGVAIRAMLRLVDRDIYIGKSSLIETCVMDNSAMQTVEGKNGYQLILAGRVEGLLPTARLFGKEEFATVDMDALDAIGELLNVINGLYVSSQKDSGSYEMCPPEFCDTSHKISGKEILRIPIYVGQSAAMLGIGVDCKVEVIK